MVDLLPPKVLDAKKRWCYEKGSNVCEICLQKFESGHPSSAKLPLYDTVVTIRGSLGHSVGMVFIAGSGPETKYKEPLPPPVPRISWCGLTIISITVILLVRNFMEVVSGDADGYTFSVTTDGRKIQVGDCALFWAGIAPPFIGIMHGFSTDKETYLKLCVNLLYRLAGVKLTKGIPEAAPNKVFYLFHKDVMLAKKTTKNEEVLHVFIFSI